MNDAIKSQYKAALKMLYSAIEKCNDELWISSKYCHQFWWMVYHALYYADFYMIGSEDKFIPFKRHFKEFEGFNSLDPKTIKAENLPEGCLIYSRHEMLEYCEDIIKSVDEKVDLYDLNKISGFSWLPFSQMEVHIYNIRHIQHHTGQLIERIRENQDLPVAWIKRD
jgi:hypothetical protein